MTAALAYQLLTDLPKGRRTCDVRGCDRVHYGLGLCHLHYQRIKKMGSLRPDLAIRSGTPRERFFRKIKFAPTGCWLWRGSVNGAAYATFGTRDGSSALAHRWAYEEFREPIPDGFHLDHLCNVRWCVNPLHLEPVTNAENSRRGALRRDPPAVCRRGHPFTEETARYDKHGARRCRACANERRARVRAQMANR